ncbi:MAG: restriction endonuclease subunit S [Desulfobacula sp.]|jgi:type I restriction enzyme S subunit|nr:restriction endonuclease subunit S [Desulfobacula sp.]
MNKKFQCKTIPSRWLDKNGRRLDCGPYMSGAIEAKELLKRHATEPLIKLTAGYKNGIFNGPLFPRVYVNNPSNGVPFLGSTNILETDFYNISLLSNKQVEENPALLIEEGWTLITCSGTIGRMVYARSNMAGMAGSQHFMRVVPDTNKILPGYLFSYLSGRFGVPIVTSGTYGAIVQHIEPHHIANLPVPRLGSVEDQAHNLIHRAADLRSSADSLIQDATNDLIETLDLPPLPTKSVSNLACSSISSANLRCRLDATFHCPSAIVAENAVKNGKFPAEKLPSVTDRLFKPSIFKRIWVENPEYGRQFISGSDAYLYEANELRYVSYRTPNFNNFIVKKGWVIFQAAGQIYGLFGSPIYVSGWQENIFCADDLYRIVPKNEIDGAYIYLFLRTPHGKILIKRQASGNSIPRVWDPHMMNFKIPWPSLEIRERFAAPVRKAHDQISEALTLQRQAIELVEEAIKAGGG